MAESEIPLSDVLQRLRQELMTSMKQAKGEDLRFEVEGLEVEMQVVVTKGGSAEAGVEGDLKFFVLDFKSKGKVAAKYESSRLQKIKLKLRPKRGDGKPGMVQLSG